MRALRGLWLLVGLGCESGDGRGEVVLTDGQAGEAAGGEAGGGAGGGAGGDALPLPPIPPEVAPCDFDNLGVRNLWLVSHSLLPETGGVRPLPAADWILYSDPRVSATFLYPPTWTAHTLAEGGESGVIVAAPEGLGFFEYSLQFMVPPDLTSRALAEAKLGAVLAPGARPRVVCEESATYDQGLGSDNTLLVVVAGADVFYLHTSVVFDPGNLGAGPPGVRTSLSSSVRFHGAPLSEFTRTTQAVYLPIIFQLLSRGGEADSDGDGYVDSADAYPFDPSRH